MYKKRHFKKGEPLPGASYYNDTQSRVDSNRLVSSSTVQVHRNSGGTFLTVRQSKKSVRAKALKCKIGKMLSNPDNPDKRDLSPGIISGAGTSYAIGVGSPNDLGVNMTPSPGHYVYAKLTWDVTVIDEVLQGGGELSNVSIKTGGTVPVNDVATEESESIHGYVCLGWWYKPDPTKDTIIWNGAGCGSIDVSFCYGSRQLTYTRNDG